MNRNFPPDAKEELRAEWDDIFGPSEFSELILKAEVPSPQFVQVLGDAVAWVTPLKAGATAFLVALLGQLGKRTADAVWAGGTDVLKRAATALLRAGRAQSDNPTISIGLLLPDRLHGTAITFEPCDATEIAIVLARLVLSAIAIETFIRDEIAAGRLGRGGARLELLPNGGFVARWYHPETREELERVFPPHPLSAGS